MSEAALRSGIGILVYQHREARGWSQRELATRAGISQGSVATVESGKVNVRVEFKPQDCWIGAYWARNDGRTHLWICIIPMFPIHLTWM